MYRSSFLTIVIQLLWSAPSLSRHVGLLQFLSSTPGEGLISPALEPAQTTVNEEDGDIRLVVARAQGLLGRVLVGYRTTPFTASSPEDYEVNIKGYIRSYDVLGN